MADIDPFTFYRSPRFGSRANVAHVARFAGFGKDKDKDKTESKPAEPEKPVHHKMPKPRRGAKSIRNALVILTSAMGIWQINNYALFLHHQAAERAAKAPPLEWKWDKMTPKTLIDTAAKVDVAVRSNPTTNFLTNYYVIILQWELAYLMLAAIRGVFKQTIRPKRLWAELHKKGITGKNMKVGVVDTGYRQNRLFSRKKVTFYDPTNLNKKIKPYDHYGYGTAVTNLISEACPDAEFVVVPTINARPKKSLLRRLYNRFVLNKSEETYSLQKDLKQFFKKGYFDADDINFQSLRKVFQPQIESISNSVRKCIDDGANVVNVNLSVEDAVQFRIVVQYVQNVMNRLSLKLSTLMKKEGTVPYNTAMKTLDNYKEWNKNLKELMETSESINKLSQEMQALYKPWLEVLDYAQKKNVPVVIAAGNTGKHLLKQQNIAVKMNLLATVDHPALIVVGSTDSDGTISDITSEFDDDIRPFCAANGSGQLRTNIRAPNRSIPAKIYMPLYGLRARLRLNNPLDASFAAPDFTATWTLMKSVCPSLTLAEGRKIISEHVTPGRFSSLRSWLLKRLVSTRRTEEIEKDEVAKRVGLGTIAGNQYDIVYAAQALNAQKSTQTQVSPRWPAESTSSFQVESAPLPPAPSLAAADNTAKKAEA